MTLPSAAFLGTCVTVGYAVVVIALMILGVCGLFRPTFRPTAILILIWQTPLLLLGNATGVLPADYIAHVGQIALETQEIREGILFPHVTHFAQLIGDPTISLYGRMYFLVASYFSVLFGPNVGVRLLLQCATLANVFALYRCAQTYTGNRETSFYLTAITYWSSYSLNNLYARGAIGEYVGTSTIMATACVLMMWWHPRTKRPVDGAIIVGLLYAFTLLTHVITGVYGALFLVIITLCMFFLHGAQGNRIRYSFLTFAIILVVVSAWLYIMIVHPASSSAIAGSFDLMRFPGLDEAWIRLLPLPISFLPREFGHRVFVTPINTVALVVSLYFAALVYRHRAGRAAVCWSIVGLLAVSILLFFISVDGRLDFLLPTALKAAQFAYRLVTYINLCFLIVTFIACTVIAAHVNRRVMLVLTGVAAIGLAMNLLQMAPGILYGSQGWWDASGFRAVSPVPYSYLLDYPAPRDVYAYNQSMGCVFAQVPEPDLKTSICNTDHVDLRIMPERSGTITASLPTGPDQRWLTTNVVNYPWNRLYADNEPVSTRPYLWFMSILVSPSGGELTYRLVPEPTYIALDAIGIISFVLLLLYIAVRYMRLVRACGGTRSWPRMSGPKWS